VQRHSALARHVDIDVDTMTHGIAPVDRHTSMRIAHIDFDRITSLVLSDLNAIVANLVAHGGYLGLDRFLVPRGNMDICIRGFHAKIGGGGKSVSFRPFVSMRRRCLHRANDNSEH
jgi:hypothetical protein